VCVNVDQIDSFMLPTDCSGDKIPYTLLTAKTAWLVDKQTAVQLVLLDTWHGSKHW